MEKKNYKDYQKKVNEEGKKAVVLMQSQPLSHSEYKNQFKKSKELAEQMRTQRQNSQKNKR